MRLKRELENLRMENRRLRLEGHGELQADEEERSWRSTCRRWDILVMRRKGQFHQVIFDTYNEMLAALTRR